MISGGPGPETREHPSKLGGATCHHRGPTPSAVLCRLARPSGPPLSRADGTRKPIRDLQVGSSRDDKEGWNHEVSGYTQCRKRYYPCNLTITPRSTGSKLTTSTWVSRGNTDFSLQYRAIEDYQPTACYRWEYSRPETTQRTITNLVAKQRRAFKSSKGISDISLSTSVAVISGPVTRVKQTVHALNR